MANAYEKIGQLDSAEESYKTLLEIEPSNIFALNNLAYLYARSDQNLDSSLSLAMKAKKLAPNDADISDTLGLIHLKKGSFLFSKQYLEDAIVKAPDNAGINFHLGDYYYRQNDFTAAKKYFKKALSLGLGKEEKTTLYVYKRQMSAIEKQQKVAETHEKKGDTKEAITHYEKILKTIGFYTPVACKLAHLYADSGQNLDRALDLAMKAKANLPKDPYLLDTLGMIYLKKGSLFMSKRFLDEAVNISPKIGLFHYHLGLLYLRRDEKKPATKELQQAIKLGLDETHLESARMLMEKI